MGVMELQRNRRTIRGPVNEFDKSTIISAYPKDIDEIKPGMQPGRFFIPAAPKDDISVAVFGSSRRGLR